VGDAIGIGVFIILNEIGHQTRAVLPVVQSGGLHRSGLLAHFIASRKRKSRASGDFYQKIAKYYHFDTPAPAIMARYYYIRRQRLWLCHLN